MGIFDVEEHICYFCKRDTKRINTDYAVPSCSETCDKAIHAQMESYNIADEQLQ